MEFRGLFRHRWLHRNHKYRFACNIRNLIVIYSLQIMAKSICPFFRNERHIWYSCGVANSSGTLELDPTFKCKRYVGLVGPVDGKSMHADVIKWKHFPRYWPFVRGIHRSPVNSPHKGQCRGALMFSLICARINGWVKMVRLVIWNAIVVIMTSS